MGEAGLLVLRHGRQGRLLLLLLLLPLVIGPVDDCALLCDLGFM